MKAYKRLVMVAIAFLVTACQVSLKKEPTSTIGPGSTPTVRTATSEQTGETVEPGSTATRPADASTIVAGDNELNPSGPWLWLQSGGRIYALNPDGTGLTLLVDAGDALVDFSVAPKGGVISYIVDRDLEDPLAGLELEMFDLATGEVRLITVLQAPDLGPSSEAGEYDWEAEQPMRAIRAPRWSHDGTRIAFVAQIDGPSSDLYVYSITDRELSRLSDGPSQAYNPVWSPDDQYIFHNGVWNFGTGAGFNDAGSWVASSDGSEMIETTGPGGTDSVVQWLDDHSFLRASWTQPCGSGVLTQVAIEDGSTLGIWDSYFADTAYNQETGRMILIVPLDWDWCAENQPTGAFLFDSLNADPEQIAAEDYTWVETDPQDVSSFLLEDKQANLYRIDASGQIRFIAAMPAIRPSYAEGTGYWAWDASYGPNPGLWIGRLTDPEPKQISDESIYNGTWSPDGQAYFYTERGGRLFRADAPDFEPVEIILSLTDGPIGSLGWLMP